MKYLIAILVLSSYWSCLSALADERWRIGVGKIDITPTEPVILAGYGSRTKPSEGIDTKLWARALVIGESKPHLVIAVDNCGVTQQITDRVFARINQKNNLQRDSFVVCSTHTHTAPSLPGYAPVIWLERAGPAEMDAAQRYAKFLEDGLVKLAGHVLANRVDATLWYGQGRVTFGGNRRVLSQGKWHTFGFQLDGHVDHSLPVLVAKNADQKPVAIWTNYACHCTTLGARNMVSGDWVGFANEEIEKQFSGAVALTTIGCGADVGPQPSGSLTIAARHGRDIADEVNRLVETNLSMKRITGDLLSNSRQVDLPFAPIEQREYWQQQSELTGFNGVHGRQMLKRIEQNGSLETALPYRITTWQFGDELGMVFLPGEVCVDYAVRLKLENDWRRLWINGWSNDVPCYIPSKKVLLEGGYEADFSMIYYNQPSRFDNSIEEKIITATNQLLGDSFRASAGTPKTNIFVHPGPEEITLNQFKQKVSQYSSEQRAMFEQICEHTKAAQNGFADLLHSDYDENIWYDFLGRNNKKRPLVRQLESGHRVEWETSSLVVDDKPVVVCFSGGLGWRSQPKTQGFQMQINGKVGFTFDITREVSHLKSDDGHFELFYLPTWTSNNDSAGFFLLVVHPGFGKISGKPMKLSVKSIGQGSQRWFAVDRQTNSTSSLRKLIDSLN